MAQSATQEQKLCRFYGTADGCRYGDQCWYSHAKLATICKFYLNNTCIYGNKCRYLHSKDNVEETISDDVITTNAAGEIKFKRVFFGRDGRIHSWFFGDDILDRYNLQVDPDYFTYNYEQRTLVIGECDFSFTVAMILKRGGIGINLFSTTFNQGLAKRYWDNFNFCFKKRCRMSFGVDATSLHVTEKRWNDNYGNKFDRILCTLPRIYKPEWTTKYYNVANSKLHYDFLKSSKEYLNENGEIHFLLFKEHFKSWKVNDSLKKLGLKLNYWCKLNPKLLKVHFKPYVPHGANGKPFEFMKHYYYGQKGGYFLCSFTAASS